MKTKQTKKQTTEAPLWGPSKDYQLREYLHGREGRWTDDKREQDR